ncbi:MAG: aminotransferase class V-fold PLP-dependent enzyme [Armatimonadota bacterium]|nr:aminotransferase class V-fold PLP-dependent enzyme [Armatimonadota bacterium]MDW8157002.1 aminotransferase class V-fold PLP-dependent enzyme [Armatimonadota bacterium]
MDDPLLRWRDEFPILQRTAYLVSHSMGAMPRSARGWVARYLDAWEGEGVRAWEAWEPYVREHADRIALLIGAPGGSVVLHQNVSTLFGGLLSALVRPGGRRKVVATELNFPSLLYALRGWTALGLQLHLIRCPDGATVPLDAWREAVDGHTLAVVVDHGIFRSGFLQDVESIGELARRQGAWVVVDAYQTVGCVPFRVQDWPADAVLGGSHKWLCGGPGAAWMYVNPERADELAPALAGWFGHRDPFAFDLELEYAPGAARFATGTPGVASLLAARAGLEVVLQVGVQAVRRKSQALGQRMIELADSLDLEVRSPRDPERRTGMVVVDFPGAEEAARELVRQGVLVDYRPGAGIRLSAHFYTHPHEVETAFEVLGRRVRRPVR